MILSPLETLLQDIEAYIPERECVALKVSKVNVAWHLDHSLKVINAVVKSMEASNPKLYKSNFTILGKLLFMLGYFPRGKAKAPKYVKPPEVILKGDIITQLEQARVNIKSLNILDKNAYFAHPLFGNINTKRVGRFLNMHTKHHLKIVKSIVG